jgi:hypothetical protein
MRIANPTLVTVLTSFRCDRILHTVSRLTVFSKLHRRPAGKTIEAGVKNFYSTLVKVATTLGWEFRSERRS